MNLTEARSILEQELSRYRSRSYSQLPSSLDCSETFERTSMSGVTYQIEMQVLFDDATRRNLRVMGAIDDGRFSSLKPMCDDFIMAPDGTPVGE